MRPPGNQRWLFRADSYRPAGELINPALYEVAVIPDDLTARAFVLEHHYSGTYPAARYRVGLYRREELVGVAVFSQPCNNRVITGTFAGFGHLDGVELGRFVLLDSVPGNGETWFLARCFELLRKAGVRGVVSYSDPCKRTLEDGSQVFGGHLGTIYQAHNGIYLGRATKRTLALLPDGSVFSDRARSKIRARARGDAGARARGWVYAVGQLVEHGARAPELDEDLLVWLGKALRVCTRSARHPGNHKYAWGFTRGVRKRLAGLAAGDYPKSLAGEPEARWARQLAKVARVRADGRLELRRR